MFTIHKSSTASKAFTRAVILRSPLKNRLLSHKHTFVVSRNNINNDRVFIGKGTPLQFGNTCRLMSSDASTQGAGGTKVLMFGGVAVLLSMVGGTLGYAGIDAEFRAYVEGIIPGAKGAFETILGNQYEPGRYVLINGFKTPSELNPLLLITKVNLQ